MKEIQYKTFSWNMHKKNSGLKKPNVCQFELTFKCGLHCRHCYTDCYNKQEYIKNELNLKQVKTILDKVYDSGVVWLCLTGGDPLTRPDFPDIYSYAKKKGFIVTIFTNGYSMDKTIAKQLGDNPPFVIELTLNAATKESYEKISQKRGSFKMVKEGIDLMFAEKLPLKIKTLITKDNFKELPKIKKFIKRIGLRFKPDFDLSARLDGDLTPCRLRISAEELIQLNGKRSTDDNCRSKSGTKNRQLPQKLFRCAIEGGDGFNIDPYGNTFACNLIRKPSFNVLKLGVEKAVNESLALVKNRKFITNSKCKNCRLMGYCRLCPGKAYLETSDMEAPIEYYCRLAQLVGK